MSPFLGMNKTAGWGTYLLRTQLHVAGNVVTLPSDQTWAGGGWVGAGCTRLGVDEGGVVKVMPSPWGATEDGYGDCKVSMTGGDESVVIGMKVEVGDGVTCWVGNMAVAPAPGLMVAANAALAAFEGDGVVVDILLLG